MDFILDLFGVWDFDKISSYFPPPQCLQIVMKVKPGLFF